MSKPINEAVWGGGFRFFPNYYKGLYRLPTEERRGAFALSIIEFMFNDVLPSFPEDSDEQWVWDMIYPNLVSSKTRAENGKKAKGKGTGPRPEMSDRMKGNQNARKQTINNEIQQDSLTPQEFVEMWNSKCPSNPKVTEITEDREQKARERILEFGKTKDEQIIKINKLLDSVNKSEFRDNWRCNFDWLIKDKNTCIQVLEGNYIRAKVGANGRLDANEQWDKE